MRSTDLAISFFTFLTVLANLATVGIVGLAVASRWPAPSTKRLWSVVKAELADGGLGLAWLVAAVCTAGSLWFSEVAGFQPCRLCWIQRACMYPLTVVLAVAAWARHRSTARSSAEASSPDGAAARLSSGALSSGRADGGGGRGTVARRARQLGVAMAAVGAAVATYHVLIERFPSLDTAACDPEVPCTVVWFERLGFVTLPFMALSGFVLIITLVAASTSARRHDQPTRLSPVPVPQETH